MSAPQLGDVDRSEEWLRDDILVERLDMPGDLNKLMYGGFMKVPVAAFGKAAR